MPTDDSKISVTFARACGKFHAGDELLTDVVFARKLVVDGIAFLTEFSIVICLPGQPTIVDELFEGESATKMRGATTEDGC